jgi:hypothetical protein
VALADRDLVHPAVLPRVAIRVDRLLHRVGLVLGDTVDVVDDHGTDPVDAQLGEPRRRYVPASSRFRDATRMAKDVDAAVTTMISNRRAAYEYERMLVADKRYVRDVY